MPALQHPIQRARACHRLSCQHNLPRVASALLVCPNCRGRPGTTRRTWDANRSCLAGVPRSRAAARHQFSRRILQTHFGVCSAAKAVASSATVGLAAAVLLSATPAFAGVSLEQPKLKNVRNALILRLRTAALHGLARGLRRRLHVLEARLHHSMLLKHESWFIQSPATSSRAAPATHRLHSYPMRTTGRKPGASHHVSARTSDERGSHLQQRDLIRNKRL